MKLQFSPLLISSFAMGHTSLVVLRAKLLSAQKRVLVLEAEIRRVEAAAGVPVVRTVRPRPADDVEEPPRKTRLVAGRIVRS